MIESDLEILCIGMKSQPNQEMRLEGYFDVFVNVLNYEAINNFICHMAFY